MTFTPWTFITVAVAGWMNRQQQEVIEYLREENRIPREKLGSKRLLLNADQKRRLAARGKALGRRLLEQFGTLFSPDTILRWHRWLIARKYDGSAHRGKPGPAPTKANLIRKLVLQMAEQNPSWGYGHIHGELKGLGYDVSWQTVRRVMLDHGLLPDPDKPYRTTWKTFHKSHWESIAAADFFTMEAWTMGGSSVSWSSSSWSSPRARSRSWASTPTHAKRRCCRPQSDPLRALSPASSTPVTACAGTRPKHVTPPRHRENAGDRTALALAGDDATSSENRTCTPWHSIVVTVTVAGLMAWQEQ